MTDSAHYPGCWAYHYPCALIRITQLEAENRRLKEDASGLHPETRSAGQLTHEVVIPLHGVGPTWACRTDEPPCR